MIYRQSLVLLLLLSTCLLSGCWDQRNIEDMDFILSGGFDARPDGKVLSLLAAPIIGGKSNDMIIYGTVARSAREGREILRHSSNGILEGGKILNMIFGESLARRGIHEYLSILERDPGNPDLATPIIVEGTAEQLFAMAGKWKNRPLLSTYIKKLVDTGSTAGFTADEDVDKFFIQYWAPGIDPLTPLIRTTPTGVSLVGSALFRDDHMVGKLDTYETFLLRSLGKGSPYHIHQFPLPSGVKSITNSMTVRFSNSNAKKKLRMEGAYPRLSYRIKLIGQLEEYPFGAPLNLSRVQNVIESTIKKDLQKLWKKLQESDSDPLGIGDDVRAHYNDYWSSHDWRKVFPHIQADFQVEAKMYRYGIIH